MKKKLGSLLVIFFLFLTGFQLLNSDKRPSNYYRHDLKHKNEIVNEFVKIIEQKTNLICSGTGCRVPHDIEEIGVSFICYEKIDIGKARKLEIETIELLSKIINSNKVIRPYLREYPFPPKRIDIMISFRQQNNDHQKPPNLSLVLQARNKIFYHIDNLKTDRSDLLYEEPYEEALKIVQEEGELE